MPCGTAGKKVVHVGQKWDMWHKSGTTGKKGAYVFVMTLTNVRLGTHPCRSSGSQSLSTTGAALVVNLLKAHAWMLQMLQIAENMLFLHTRNVGYSSGKPYAADSAGCKGRGVRGGGGRLYDDTHSAPHPHLTTPQPAGDVPLKAAASGGTGATQRKRRQRQRRGAPRAAAVLAIEPIRAVSLVRHFLAPLP
eukprot:349674-Chlamydomonas_euryale.AAC.8